MPETSFDVQIHKTDKYVGKTVTTWRVRWSVAGTQRRKGHRTAAAADGFRSELITAQRRGEPFDVDTGLPAAQVRKQAQDKCWVEFAREYVDMKWPAASATYRRAIAEAITNVTVALLPEPAEITGRQLRSALTYWGFNTGRRREQPPAEVALVLAWVERNSPPLSRLAEPGVVRKVLEAFATKLDGTRASATVVNRKRAVLFNALSYAVELGLLEANPVVGVRWRAPKTTNVVDRRSVVNPEQAKRLLDTVAATPRSGPRLVAFFALLYYAALRPEEAAVIRVGDLDLPDEGMGWITIDRAAPDAGKEWTDSGEKRDDRRQLKHRAVGETRRVPCRPELVAIVKEHIRTFGVAQDGRLFSGERSDTLATVTYIRLWDRAREAALTSEQYASPLARRPYDLRHAAVSSWLAVGVAPTRIAEWAGHSVEVLLSVYAKCLDGGEAGDLRKLVHSA